EGDADNVALAFPLALKALCAELPHKTDVGGVSLSIKTKAHLSEQMAVMRDSVTRARPDIAFDRFLVQTMASGIGEVLIGFRRDPDVGPIVLLAPGGIFAELSGERSLRLAPVDEAEAQQMISEIGALRALSGYRGKPCGDLDALAKAICALSHFADDSDVAEVEINPLIVRRSGEGVVAVDALMRIIRKAEQ
ncbi:MAG TPA: acetate--CoA ligase family protein, partial [Rhizomicrobium sp.]|nr:acetate--CoA ligase family protein [Rhizomicrobium sp.]